MSSSPRFVKLNNGAILELETVAQIVRKDINDYGVVTKPAGIILRADSDDVKFVEGLLGVVSTPREEPAAKEPTIATA